MKQSIDCTKPSPQLPTTILACLERRTNTSDLLSPEMVPKDQKKASLLSPAAYDDDAPDVGSDGEQFSDEEKSAERVQDEQEVFEDDYEEEELGMVSSGPGVSLKRLFNRGKQEGEQIPMTIKERRAQKRASRRHRERVKRGEEEAELVYGMEEGGEPSQSPSRNSSESDLQRLGTLRSEKKASRAGHCYTASRLTIENRPQENDLSTALYSTSQSYYSSSFYCLGHTKLRKRADRDKPNLLYNLHCRMEPLYSLLRLYLSRWMASVLISSSAASRQP
jgi:hypothetical protein